MGRERRKMRSRVEIEWAAGGLGEATQLHDEWGGVGVANGIPWRGELIYAAR